MDEMERCRHPRRRPETHKKLSHRRKRDQAGAPQCQVPEKRRFSVLASLCARLACFLSVIIHQSDKGRHRARGLARESSLPVISSPIARIPSSLLVLTDLWLTRILLQLCRPV